MAGGGRAAMMRCAHSVILRWCGGININTGMGVRFRREIFLKHFFFIHFFKHFDTLSKYMISFSQFSIFYFKLLDLGMSCCNLLSVTLKLITGWISGRAVFVGIFLSSRFSLGWPGIRGAV